MKASGINYLVDTGPLVATLDKSDEWHAWSASALGALGETLWTSEAVITEVCYHLRGHRPALRMLMGVMESGVISVLPLLPAASGRIGALLQKYDRMDFADATLVVLSELHPSARLVTLDRRDFSIYRRSDERPVPALMPDAG